MQVIVFPLRDNPYQKYLYDNLEKYIGRDNIHYFKDIDISNRINFIKYIFTWPYKLFIVKGDNKIFHLHWQFFYFLFNKKILTYPTIALALWMLSWVKFFGFKIIWTVHDYNQHETNPMLDDYIRKVVIYFSDQIIVLNKITRDTLIEKDDISPNKIILIPIGNYGTDKIYIPTPKTPYFVFSFFGLVRKYKGVERLINVFKEIKIKNIKLKIIGDCYDKTYFKHLKNLCGNDKRIMIEDKYMSSEELTSFIHNSHISVLPFIEVTNSSSAMLSYSKGRPIIAPLIGAFKEHPSDIGYFYIENNEIELKQAIIKSLDNHNDLQTMGIEALKYSKSFKWSDIGLKTYKAYENVLK